MPSHEPAGYPLFQQPWPEGEYRVAFFDTMRDFGFFTEVAEVKASFLVNLSQISQACAQWDGTDPVRILTRDGYHTP